MSGSSQHSNIVSSPSSESETVVRNIRALRDEIVIAWRERSVILSPEQQDELKAEIRQTCDFLTELTQHS